ncbi:MAG: glycosyltransferase family 39 protein [Nitrospinae bacterium]|nr:glycosyltransferase family 39 protein [Nitrospinota bacterium]
MFFFLLLAIFLRLCFLEVPLERDEGEYAYMGQNLLRGILPYSEAYNMKFPGIYFVYAAILVLFGQTHTGIHSALLLVNIATSLMLYLIGRRWIDGVSGFVAGSSFLVLTLSPSLQGYWANSEHFVIFFVSMGFFLVLLAEEKEKGSYLFFGGLFLGSSFLIKQHAVFFPVFGFIYICSVYLKKTRGGFRACLIKTGLFSLGAAIPFLLTIILFSTQGLLGQFFFWTFRYAAEYASQVPISEGFSNFKRIFFPVMRTHFPIFVLFFFGLAGATWIKSKPIRGAWVYGFFIASFLAVCPGWFFRPHYFVLLLPSIALLAGIGASFILKKLPPKKWAMAAASPLFIIFISYPIFSQGKLLLNSTPHELCRTVYGLNPFPESLEIARFIKKNTANGDVIAVLGSEPQIYFYSNRKAATGYIYAYPLMESHGFALKMQKEMVRQIESAAPKYILYTNIPTSWLAGKESELMIFDWLNAYLDKGYVIDGVVDIISSNFTAYKWGEEARRYSPVSGVNFFIFRKKT